MHQGRIMDYNEELIERPLPAPIYTFKETILVNGAYFNALFNDVSSAKTSIDLSTYIFNTDFLGTKLAEELAMAAKRGVKVRLLIDGVGARFTSVGLIETMKEAGVNVRIYHPLPWRIWQMGHAAHVPDSFIKKVFYLFTKINSRNHRKLCIIDQNIIYISSANIDKCHLQTEDGGDGWRDTSVRITGMDTSYLEYAYERAWQRFSISERLAMRFRNNGTPSIFHFNFTRQQRRRIYKQLLLRISQCQRRVWITNAYFVPDSYLQQALIDASKRNVDVRILLPSTTDVLISSLVTSTFYASLLKNGVSIFEYLSGVLHAKILIIDDWYSLGSSNLNSRSMKHDLEADVTIQTSESKRLLERQFLRDLKESQRIDLTYLKKNSSLKTFWGRLLLFMRYWI